MANEEHVKQLRRGPAAWNAWREQNPTVQPELQSADLRGLDLTEANLKYALLLEADLRETCLRRTWLVHADLGWHTPRLLPGGIETREVGADLRGADLREVRGWRSSFNGALVTDVRLENAQLQSSNVRGGQFQGVHAAGLDARWTDFTGADLSGADMWGADLQFANFFEANLTGCRLSEAQLDNAMLARAMLRRAVLAGTSVYGISAWDVDTTDSQQAGLLITRPPEPAITVGDLEVAQFIHLLRVNDKLRSVIDTVSRRVVLILGRFTANRKPALDRARDELERRGYVPVVFDFDPPESRSLTETIRILAHLSRFVVVDLTEPRSVPQEITSFVPDLPSVPVLPLLNPTVDREYGMFEHWRAYPWVLEIVEYRTPDELADLLTDGVIERAEAAAERQQGARRPV